MDLEGLIHTTLNVGAAFLLGGVIGFERQWRQRLAGLRTNTLVAIGAATFVVFGGLFPGESGSTRIAGQIVTGVGFLGAGVIFKEGLNIWGLNTAATLWCSAAVGVLCGAGLFSHAIVATVFIISVNLLLPSLTRLIGRQPLTTTELDSRYAISVVCQGEAEAHVRALLLRDLGTLLHIQQLESSNIEDSSRVEVNATLRADKRQDQMLEQIIGRLSLEAMVTSASWRFVTPDGVG
jgi:putative Mg2+ transporter-C (MgtC) family protein